MSATLRYDIGHALSVAMFDATDAFLSRFGQKMAARWAGVYRDRWECETFAVKLPRQVGDAWRLVRILGRMQDKKGADAVAVKGAHILAGKLAHSLGLPFGPTLDTDESGFLRSIDAAPDDLTTWLVYADWLDEHPNEAIAYDVARWRDLTGSYPRANIVRAWLDPKKAAKVRYGVLHMPEERWGSDRYKTFPWGDFYGQVCDPIPDIFEAF